MWNLGHANPRHLGGSVGGMVLPQRLIGWTAAAWLSVLVLGGVLFAQDGPMEPAPAVSPDGTTPETSPPVETPPQVAAPPRVEPAKPSLYYLKDSRGNLQAVPGFTLEEFEELYRHKENLALRDERPRYSVQRLLAQGEVVDRHAELTAEVSVLVRSEDWVRVPLRFDEGALREPARHEGDGEQLLQYEPDGGGYIAWIRGPTDKPHKLTLKLLVPVKRVGEQSQLTLQVPRATLSELKLRVPAANAVAQAAGSSSLLTPRAVGQATEFTLLGLDGSVDLSWHPANGRTTEVPTVLEAVGTILARADSFNIDLEGTLSVRSYGGPFERFRVRLPQGAELIPGKPSGYSIAPVEVEPGDQTQTTSTQGRVMEVRLAKKTSGPVEVHLRAQRPHDAPQPNQPLEISGFEVLGAARQWGHVAMTAAGDWQVVCTPGKGVRRVDQVPEALRHENLVAGFEYFTQPYAVSVRLVPKQTRVLVEPEHLLLVGAERATLESTLTYTVRGAKVSTLNVAMAGWQLDDVGPANMVDVDSVSVNESGMLSIPLSPPATGQIELTLRAHRPFKPETPTLVLPLPQPEGSSPGQTGLIVLPDDNVELIPDSEKTRGLVRQRLATERELPARQQEPLYYQGEASEALFVAALRVHPRQVAVEADAHVDLQQGTGHVEQRLRYTVDYEPLERFLLDVPRSIAGATQLEFEYEGETLAPQTLAADPPEKAGPVRMQIGLPEARIGSCELIVRYPLPSDRQSSADLAELDVPLVMPAEGALASNQLQVRAAAPLHVETADDAWTVQPGATAADASNRILQLVAAERCDRAKLRVRLVEETSLAETVVRRAWIQTRLVHTPRPLRQDRAVFNFTTSRRRLELTLPPGVLLGEMRMRLDGREVLGEALGDDLVAVSLPEAKGPLGSHVLELWLPVREAPAAPGGISLELPHIGDDTWVNRLYWELLLPRNEHVVRLPSGFTSESTWGWNGYFVGRRPLLTQAQLEQWVGVAPAQPQSNAGANRYVFSSLGVIGRGELRTARRSWIVLGASGIALLIGLLLIYVPSTRHTTVLLALGAGLLAAMMLHPEATLLAAQAAALGLTLALAAGLLQYLVTRRRRLPGVPPSSVTERLSSQAFAVPPAAAGSSSTRTMAGIVLPEHRGASPTDSNP